jgi:hypothetical protein
LKLFDRLHARFMSLALLAAAVLVAATALWPQQGRAFGTGYEGPLRFESEGAFVNWRDTPDSPLQSRAAGDAVLEVGVGKGGKLAYRVGLWLRFAVPGPVEGTVTVAGDSLRGFNFPFRFTQPVPVGRPASGIFWTPWTQCTGGGSKGDLCVWLDLERARATSGSHITWAHMNRTAGPSGKAAFGPDDTFEINVMPLDGLATLSFSDRFPEPEPAN